jgi:hypothetical protein
MLVGDKIICFFNSLERDWTQNRRPLLLIALCHSTLLRRTMQPDTPASSMTETGQNGPI